jgi:hypothetical protein
VRLRPISADYHAGLFCTQEIRSQGFKLHLRHALEEAASWQREQREFAQLVDRVALLSQHNPGLSIHMAAGNASEATQMLRGLEKHRTTSVYAFIVSADLHAILTT